MFSSGFGETLVWSNAHESTMTPIQNFMTSDHRYCDTFFTLTEIHLAAGHWSAAQATFVRFQALVLQHFCAEEQVLFPAFEEQTGMRTGPTQVMRSEHMQLRALMDAAQTALQAQDDDDYSGHAETLLIMLQQHNTKEENVLYPMCDQLLGPQAAAVSQQLANRIPPVSETTP